MPTKKPRLHVTLEPEHYAAIKRLAELQNRSMSALVADFLGEVTPVLDRIAETLEIASRVEASAVPDYVHTLDEAHARIEPVMQDLFRGFAELEKISNQGSDQADAVRGVSAVAARAGIAPSAASASPDDPQPITWGSESDKVLKYKETQKPAPPAENVSKRRAN